MSQATNKELSQSIIAIIAILGLVAIVEFFVLAMMSGGVGSNEISNMAEDPAIVDARIKPVVTLADIRGDSSAAPAAAPVVAEKSAKELYDGACMACHANGVAGAPKPSDKAAWESRYANGFASLLASVKNGKGAMPPKGGSAYSDAELTKAIEHILIESGLMSADTTSPSAVKATEPETVMADKAPEPTAAATEKANDVDLAAGEKAYRSACAACHDSGVAGAPKLGDTAAWESRKEAGLEAITQNSINGKGAMPPKGGAAYLSDADMKNIVGFMLSKI